MTTQTTFTMPAKLHVPNRPMRFTDPNAAMTAIRLYGAGPRLRRLAMAIRVFVRLYAPDVDPSTVAMPHNAEQLETALSVLTPKQIRQLPWNEHAFGWGIRLEAFGKFISQTLRNVGAS